MEASDTPKDVILAIRHGSCNHVNICINLLNDQIIRTSMMSSDMDPTAPWKITKAISRSSILEHLHLPDEEGAFDGDDVPLSDVAVIEHAEDIDRLTPDADIKDMKLWLGNECEKERARVGPPEFGAQRLNAVVYHDLAAKLRSTFPGMDTKLLERMGRGEGTRDFAPEDLLAPLRLGVSRSSGCESYSEMMDVLLAWNKHVSHNRKFNPNARQQLLQALKARCDAAFKVLSITMSKSESAMYDEVGQEAILEPSKRNLVKALHAYRPETAQFADQSPFSMLIMLWANIGRESPDIIEDNDMRDATFKVLSAEAQLVLRFLNAEIRWSVVDSKDAAKRRKDIPEVVRCKERIDQFDKEVTKSSLLRTMNGIARARGELRKIVVEELLELAMLQAALKWAAWKVGDRAPVTAWIDVLERCAEVDQMFHKARRFGLEDLDMVVGVVSTTLGSMRTIHDSTLTRAIKIAGKDLAKMDEAAQIRIVDQRKREPVTALMMSDTLTGVKEAQLAAREMLKHLFLMEASLGELLKGVESRHRAYDECAALLPPEDEVVEREVFGRFEV